MPPQTLTAGTRLGAYEILAPLGAGGMGEVYKAHDAKLKRDVAIKILPDALGSDAAARARFEREAQSVAALSHPNVLGIFDFGVDGSTPFAVMELLDGGTLRDTLQGGALPPRKTVEYAQQIAAGLSAAHATGITHRDLKPENIFLTRDGRIKILDFGLAKVGVTSPASAPSMMATSPALTGAGSIVGTVGYMAPEQVRGQDADHRSDIFSFGAILYELLSGQRAFTGDSSVETMNAILKEDPPELTRANVALPPALDRVVRRCLEKNPDERFQSARDVAFALEALFGTPSSSAVVSPIASNRSRTRPLVTALAALLLVALTAVASRRLWPVPVPPAWTGIRMGGPEFAMDPRMSPDGHTLAFQTMVDSLTQVAVMKPESGSWTVLTHQRNAGWVLRMNWAPDGNTIYYDREADVPKGIFSVSVLGGEERLVLEDAYMPTAVADGSLLVFRLNAEHHMQLFRFWPDTGRLQAFPIEISAHHLNSGARVFPDGKEAVVRGRLLSGGDDRDHLYRVDLLSGQVRRLVEDDDAISAVNGLSVTPDGQWVIAAVRSGDLYGVVRFPRNGRALRETLLLLTNRVIGLDVGPDGSLYIDQTAYPNTVMRLPVQGGHTEKIAVVGDEDNAVAVLPDNRIVVAAVPAGRWRLFALAAGKDPMPLVNTAEETRDPAAPVGRDEVAFLIGHPGNWAIAIANISNGRITRRVPFDKGAIESLVASPDGSTLYVAADSTVWSVPVAGGAPRKIRAGNSAVVDPSGQRLIVQVFETSHTRLFDVPLDGGAEREITLSGGFSIANEQLRPGALGGDGRLLVELVSPDSYFFPPGLVDLATGRVSRIQSDRSGDHHFIAWGSDGHVIAMANDVRASIWRFRPEH